MPPGSRALGFVSRWFEPAIVHRTIEPLIADWQREWIDAPSRYRRIGVRIRGSLSFLITFAACSTSIARTPAPAAVVTGIAVRVIRFTIIGTAFLLLPAIFGIDLNGRWYLLLFQIPAAAALIFPFAMIGAADEIWTRDGLPPHVARAVAAKTATFSVVAMLVYGGFVVPAANHAWRVEIGPDREHPPIAGVRELSTFTLLTDPMRVPDSEAFSGSRDRTARIRGELQQRAAMALQPLTLLWLRWSALTAPRRGWFRPLPATGAVTISLTVFLIAFFLGWRLESEFAPGTGVGAWLPIVALSLGEGFVVELRKRTA